jgi:DNA-binding CsgD family transcriptional regulator
MAEQQLVGRGSELAEIERFLQRSGDGSRALQIEGAAGMGKTALWLEGVTAGRRRACVVLTARPVEIETKLSYAGLTDLLEPVLDDVLTALTPPQRRALEVALLVAPARSQPDQRTVAAAFLSALRALAQEQEVLVAIDDLQWLDSSSHQVTAFAARRLGPEPVGFLVTRRVDDDGRPSMLELEHVLSEERLSRMRLGPLELDALQDLIEAGLGNAISRPLLRRIHRISGGNPFFALEQARALRAAGLHLETGTELPVPPTLRSLVQERLGRISGDEREVLLAVAALAAPTRELLVSFAGADGNGWPPLINAFDSHIVEVVDGQIRFTHPLLGSVLYSDTPLPMRQDVHRRLAELVSDPEESARHLALAVDVPDAEVASRLERAALVARGRGAPSSSAELLELAIARTSPADGSALARRHVEAARQWGAAGDTARSHALLERAVTVAPPGSERAEALVHLGRTTAHGYGDCRSAAAVLARALEEGVEDLRVRVALETELTWAHHMLGDLALAEQHAHEAVVLAESLGERSVLAEALADLGLVQFLRRRAGYRATVDRAVTLDREEREERRAQGAAPLAYWWMTDWQNAMTLAWAGELDASRDVLEAVRREALERGDEQALPYVLQWLSRIAFARDEWADAAMYAELGYAATISASGERAFSLAWRATVAAARGEVDAARAMTDEGIRLASSTGIVSAGLEHQVVRGGLELSLGDIDAAHHWLAPLPAALERHGFAEPAVFRFDADLIETLAARGDVATAVVRVAELEAIAQRFPASWAAAAAARCRGLLAAEAGAHDEAFAQFEAALARHAAAGERYERARTLLLYGVALRRAKQKRAARDALTLAERLFSELGAEVWGARARGELQRIGGAAPRSGDLTETEQRIAGLATSGKANKQIAAELHITVRTVESNLTRIYRKLGVSSRAQLTQLVRQ